MIEDLKTLIWFLTKPSLYLSLIDLILRKFFLPDHDSGIKKEKAKSWCVENQSEVTDVFLKYKLNEIEDFQKTLNNNHFQNVEKKIMRSDYSNYVKVYKQLPYWKLGLPTDGVLPLS